MPPQLKRVLKIETTWINEYGRTYLPTEAGFSFSAEDLRAAGMNLVQVRYVLSHGRVVYADKLDDPGAIWVVEGEDNDENEFRLTVKVISEELDVTLIKIEKIERVEKLEQAKKVGAVTKEG
jgi:hypothetical protein